MNILKVDFDAVNEEIYKYNGEGMPYFICSEETEKLIISKCSMLGSKEGIEKFKEKGMIGAYCGCKVLHDNSLKFGEVEIR